MILDGYWKKELKHINRQLLFLTKHRLFYNDRYIEHKVNRFFLFSAAIIRKVIEDEKDTEKIIDKHNQAAVDEEPWPIPKLPVIKIDVPIIKFNHIVDDKFFVNSRVCIEDYDTCNPLRENISLVRICNQIIHSYAWEVIYKDKKNVYAVMMASDFFLEKEVYFITIKDWIEAINNVVRKCCI